MNKKLTWLHISDIHFMPKLHWRDSPSRTKLLDHLRKVFSEKPELAPDFIFCTGDIAFGSLRDNPLSRQYEEAEKFFSDLAAACSSTNHSLALSDIYIVPGNHDVDRNVIDADANNGLLSLAANSTENVSLINQRFSDRTIEFRNAIKRIDEYSKFIAKTFPHIHDPEGRQFFASVVNIREMRIGIAGFNSAWSCSGEEDDRKIWLAGRWQFGRAAEAFKDCDIRIGLIHHPTDWLNVAERQEAVNHISTEFDFWLHGHTHEPWITPTKSSVVIGAGAIGALDSEEFGINIVQADFAARSARCHFFTKRSRGTGWTIMPIPEHAPYGVWEFALPNGDKPVISRGNSENTNPISSDAVYSEFRHPAPVTQILENHLKRAMRTYASQPSIWIEPVIASRPETDRKDESATLIEYHQIYSPHPIDRLIISPPEYGLTCLARKLVLDSWRTHGALWLYIDCAHLKPNRAALQLAASEYANELGKNKSTFKFILLDGLNHNGISEANKMLELVASEFPLASLICTYSNQSGSLAEVLNSESLARKFQVCYLWALPRAKIRQIVSNYNTQKYIGDEDAVTARLVSDLEVLNLPRTPLNCLTLLKASEIDFEESPVNRSEVIKRVLFLLFSVDSIPTYKSRPDVKDCEYVLGYFCEQLIRSNTYGFARDIFLARIQSFCGERLINIDINLLFDILYQNSIIVSVGNSFQFRFSYWILYFAAHRMTHDESFKALIFAEMRYAQFPEIIEFYTGIDRKRDDALEQIEKDIKRVTQYVKDGTGLPADLNPYKLDIWKPSEKVEERMRQEVVNGIQESSLPAEFKDHYADRNYDRSKPYNQRITTLLSEASVFSLYQGLRAAGRALRNSDYVSPEIKRSLLAAIQEGWDEFAKVIFIVLPALALDGQAYYDGTRFFLQGNFGNTTEARANNILLRIPANVAEWFGSDVYSQKLSPLIYDRLLSGGGSAVSKHVLTLLLITYTPKGWEQKVSDYITAMKKNSFYLLDIYTALRAKYRYGFASPATLREINFLIKMTAAKHVTGDKSPGPKAIKSANLPDDVIPKRIAR